MVLPNIQAQMTGVWLISKAHDLVTLTYLDGQKESGMISNEKWKSIFNNPFAIVGEIQSQRKEGAK
jgi:hypothetical protein